MQTIAEKLTQLVSLVRFFNLLALSAGLAMLASAAFSSRYARARDTAYLKVMGADQRFLAKALLWENLSFGLLCSLSAWSLAQLASWGICHWQLEISSPLAPLPWMLELTAPALVIAAVGYALARPTLQARPARYL